jgi:nitronate monooxygenase
LEIITSREPTSFSKLYDFSKLNDDGSNLMLQAIHLSRSKRALMPAHWNRNRRTAKLGIDYPIIQGPFGGLSSQRLTAAVSNFGGLGSFGANGLAPEAIKDVIAEIRSLTSKPFAMNLWVSMEDEGARTSDESAFNRSLAPLAAHFASLGVARPAYKPYSPIRFEDQARVLLHANVPAFSFIFGIPSREILDECRAKGIVTIGAATTPDEAALLQEAGVDAIAASGFEAGGHRGSFLRAPENSLTGTFSLVPQVVEIVDVPVIAAGGIADARGIVAALALGAEAVQMGTAFLACEESGAGRLYRETLLAKKAGHTGLTKGFTGRLARGIHNRVMEEWNREGTEILPYPLQRGLVRNLTMAAEAAGRSDLLQMWAGQSANLSACTDVSTFLQSLVDEVSEIAGQVVQWSANHRQKHSNSKEKSWQLPRQQQHQ